jgi:RNA polymerase-binding transcription factor DksA
MDLNHIEARIQEELSHTLVNIDDIREQLCQTAVQSSDCCDAADIEPARLAFDATCTHCISCQTTKEMNEHLYR